jgi:predicted nucleic acid-binding protein
MVRKDIFFIDTNIVMYARGKAHPYKKPCVRVIRQIADGSFQERFGTPVTDSEVFQEILYRYALIGQWEIAISVCNDFFLLGLEILAVGPSEVWKMMELARNYSKARIAPRDIVHAAVMVNNGIRRIVTTDKHFDLIKEVIRVDPLRGFVRR